MIKKKILVAERVRKIDGGFSFIPHRFLTDGFFALLNPDELLLYFFLVLTGDRSGLSFYSYDKICTLLQMSLDQYINARNSLIEKDLIAFDGTIFQVLSLPRKAIEKPAPCLHPKPERKLPPESVGDIFKNVFKRSSNA
jgi:hypothetical protein